ncbi:hypothetical protein [Allostreptomyces psammosilenae]|uniref:Uncharacterized protein n=1 Tax=Allostreptomyces psammosilenae TaxID=1892865 RepID=A0A852ZXC0_9ACTN|nr:hypothetical protein [Allostreptomyces psammosilenae]NYI06996.1 hypothetical protein [Allostreptomyces psammosilenae]
MGIFRRRRATGWGVDGTARGRRSQERRRVADGIRHLEEFAAERTGVEAFVEPPTAVTSTTVVLVARSGEWTRRRVPDARAAHELGSRLGIPVYDAGVVGYPQRMREWNRRRAEESSRAASEAGDGDPTG